MEKQTVVWRNGSVIKGKAHNWKNKKQIGATEEEECLNVAHSSCAVGRTWLKGKFLMVLSSLEALTIRKMASAVAVHANSLNWKA